MLSVTLCCAAAALAASCSRSSLDAAQPKGRPQHTTAVVHSDKKTLPPTVDDVDSPTGARESPAYAPDTTIEALLRNQPGLCVGSPAATIRPERPDPPTLATSVTIPGARCPLPR